MSLANCHTTFFLNTCLYECHVDEANKLVTTPAFMYHDPSQGWHSVHLIFDGVGKMISAALAMCK